MIGAGCVVYKDVPSNTTRELAELTASEVGRKVIIDVPDDIERHGYNPVTKSVFSTDKLEALGWKPLTHIEEGIEKTIKKSMN